MISGFPQAGWCQARQSLKTESVSGSMRDFRSPFECVVSDRATLRLYMLPRGNLVDGLPRAPSDPLSPSVVIVLIIYIYIIRVHGKSFVSKITFTESHFS